LGRLTGRPRVAWRRVLIDRRRASGALAGIALDTALQAIQVGETLLPMVVPGLHVDMPGAGEYRGLAAPVAAQLDGACGAGGGVVVGTDQQAGEGQGLARNRREITQGRGAIAALYVGRGDQQRAAYTAQ